MAIFDTDAEALEWATENGVRIDVLKSIFYKNYSGDAPASFMSLYKNKKIQALSDFVTDTTTYAEFESKIEELLGV